jgi:polyphosphate glucokinase
MATKRISKLPRKPKNATPEAGSAKAKSRNRAKTATTSRARPASGPKLASGAALSPQTTTDVKPLRPTQSAPSAGNERFTLAVDIGGTHVKASVLDGAGRELVARVELPTPRPSPPDAVLKAIAELVASLPPFDRISAGFPGVVVRGCIVTAPNLGTQAWHGFDLAAALTRQLGKPARVLNDAEVQGFGVIEGKGLECVVTLGTGFGSALYRDGELMPHLELGQHPIWKQKTYDQYIGIAALRKHGDAKWNRRVQHAIAIVHTLLNYDHLYIGGGNAMRLDFALPTNVTRVSNEAGITGGVALWRPGLERMFSSRPA